MFEFLGRLMGLSLRTKACLPFFFPPLVYKALVGERPAFEDLLQTDTPFAQLLDSIRTCEVGGMQGGTARPPITGEEAFAAAYPGLRFAAPGSDGVEVDLLPGGRDIPVTFANRMRYVEAAERFRLHEFDTQLAAIRRGFANLVPAQALTLFTAAEAETLVAGRPDVDPDVLKAHTEYSGYSEDDKVIKTFWKVFASLTASERSNYLRFVWGRSR
jgi:E3 ubiquitin-protein ligase HERC1